MTSISPQAEYPPILPIGFHLLTLEDLRDLCVTCFPNSKTRHDIMAGLEDVIQRLTSAGVAAEIWVNGSFLTQKHDPGDSDLVLRLPIEAYERGSEEQKATLDWVRSNLKQTHLCDSYLFYVFPSGDNRAILNDYNHAYWIRQFGFSRGLELKGIAVLHTGGGS
jgi:hypothetical protein